MRTIGKESLVATEEAVRKKKLLPGGGREKGRT